MRLFISLFITALSVGYHSNAQPNISRVEWYLDNDPGYGNATAINITPDQNLVNLNFVANISSVTPGLHIIGMRGRDAKGAWSLDHRWLFIKPSTTSNTTNIARVEWYLDTDPGYGNATLVSLSPGQNLINLNFVANIANVTPGLHIIGMRGKDVNGAWSLDNRWLFIKPSTASGSPNITQVEWYLDTDPGYGNATAISIATSQDLANLNFVANIASFTPGLHIIGMRGRDANGAWSLDNKWLFVKPSTASGSPNITQVEWYLDTDPGYGNATAINISPGQDLVNLNLVADLTSLTTGLHIIGMRGKDANGAWSLDNRWLISKLPVSPPLPNITQMEYFIDSDPGYGKGIPLAFLPRKDVDTLRAFINVTGLSSGKHKIFYRGRDNNGAWSLDNRDSFMISSPIASPAILVNSIEFTPVCKGLNFQIGYHATGTYNPTNNFIAEISDKNGSFSTPRQVGNKLSVLSGLINCAIGFDAETGSNYKLRIRSTNPAITGSVSEQSISVNRYYIGNDTFSIVVCANNTANITNLYNPLNSTLTYSLGNPAASTLGIHSVYAVSTIGCKDTALVNVKQDIAIWTGNSSTDWHTAGNWNTGKVPNDSTHVIIPVGTTNGCTISTADANAASIQLRSGAMVLQVLNNRKLMIKAKCDPLPN